MSEITRGEWKYSEQSNAITVSANDSENPELKLKIAEIWTIQIPENEFLANAHLISAAPDLLEACESAYKFLDMVQDELLGLDPWEDILINLEKAITKAKGENL